LDNVCEKIISKHYCAIYKYVSLSSKDNWVYTYPNNIVGTNKNKIRPIKLEWYASCYNNMSLK